MVVSPEHWEASYGYEGTYSCLAWGVTDPGDPPAEWVDEGNLYLGDYNPRPGEYVTGFVIQSPDPPDSVDYYVQAWRDIPGDDTEEPPTLLGEGPKGKTLGPVPVGGVPGDDESRIRGRGLQLAVVANPAHGTARMNVTSTQDVKIELKVIDVTGRLVRSIYTGQITDGQSRFTWDGRDDGGRPVPSGVYVVALESTEGRAKAKVVLIR